MNLGAEARSHRESQRRAPLAGGRDRRVEHLGGLVELLAQRQRVGGEIEIRVLGAERGNQLAARQRLAGHRDRPVGRLTGQRRLVGAVRQHQPAGLGITLTEPLEAVEPLGHPRPQLVVETGGDDQLGLQPCRDPAVIRAEVGLRLVDGHEGVLQPAHHEQRAAQRQRRTPPAGGVHGRGVGLAQPLLGPGIRRARGRHAQLLQQLRAHGRLGLLLQSARETGHGDARRAAVARPASRLAQGLHDLRAGGRVGHQQVHGTALRIRAALGQNAGRLGVRGATARGRHLLLHRCAHYGVDEVQLSLGAEHVGRRQRVRRLGRRVGPQARQLGRRVERDVLAHHRHRLGELGGRRGQRGQPHQNCAGDRLGCERGHPARSGGGGGDALLSGRAQELSEQEGIAAARLEARVGEGGIRLGPGHLLHELLHRRPAEWPRRQHAGATARHQRLDQPETVILRSPGSGQNQHGHALETPGQVSQPFERGEVCAVQVVDHQDERGPGHSDSP